MNFVWLKSRHYHSQMHLKVPRKNLYLASSSFWWLPAFLGLWLHHSNLHYHQHTDFFCSQVSLCLPLINTYDYFQVPVKKSRIISPSQGFNAIIPSKHCRIRQHAQVLGVRIQIFLGAIIQPFAIRFEICGQVPYQQFLGSSQKSKRLPICHIEEHFQAATLAPSYLTELEPLQPSESHT